MMAENENGFTLKEMLVKYMDRFDKLKEQYDTQSTSIYEKSKESNDAIDRIGKKSRDLDKRVGVLELRVYAAVTAITILGFVIQTFWK